MLVLPAELTQAQATRCLAALSGALPLESGAEGVHIDASALTRFDSAALAVLLELRRQSQRLGRRFQAHALPVPLLDLARLYGIDALLTEAP